MAINFKGYLFDDSGNAIQGATVQLLEQDGTQEATTTTSSAGLWSFSEADQDTYDVKITSGSSIRWIQWDDQISIKEIDVRNDTGATTPAVTFTNLTNATANQVAKIGSANTTRADDDEIYVTYELANDAGEVTEFGRMTVVATDVSNGSEDGQIEFDVMKAGTLTKVWTITSSASAAMSFDMNVDALTIGSGADTDVSLTFDANSADGVITWMEDEDYFQFSDDILMSTAERINLRDTAIYIYSSADGQLDLIADTEIQIAATTVDINGNVDVSGTYTGAGLMTTGGNIVIPNAGNIGSASDTDAIAISSGGVVTMNQIPVFSAGINVSGGTIAGTLATAAQGNVTSLGTLTALTVDDVAVNGKVITMTGSSSDTAIFTAGTHGTLSIVTTDDAAAAANIQITADGTVDIDSAGVLTLDSGAAINIEPASGSAILLDGTISVDAGVVTGATSITSTVIELGHASDTTIARSGSGAITVEGTQVLLAGAQTGVTTILNASTKIGRDTDNLVDFATTDNNIIFRANGENQLTLSDGALTPSSNAIVDLGTDALEFKDAYFDGTLEADAITIGGTNVVTGSLITTLGTVSAGVWQGTAIASGYIAADAITGAKIADDAIDSEHYAAGSIDTAHIADDQITLAKMASGTDGNIISYDASGNPVAIATGNDGQVLTSAGAGAPPAFEDAAGGGATFIDFAADQTVNNSNTLQADDYLIIPVAANKRYGFTALLNITTPTAAVGLQYDWAHPTGTTGFYQWHDSVQSYHANRLITQGETNWGFDSNPTNVYLVGQLENGSNAGNVIFQWCQINATASDTKINKGSWATYWLLN